MTDEDTTPTETTTATVGDAAPKATMGEFSHTNPHTGKSFGDDFAFQRGPTVAADGGERDAVEETDEESAQTMRDVDHEHPDDDAADANRVFQRGADGRDGSV
jgi:hypothetical protein